MTGWRDDLPPIPSERIRTAALREGSRRREVRANRQRAMLYSGVGAAAVALIVLIAVQSEPSEQAGDGGAAPEATAAATTEAAPATTAAPAITRAESATAEETSAPAATEAPGTTAAPATTAPATDAPTESPADTTVPGTIASLPVSGAVVVTPSVIYEQPTTGVDCGPTTVTVVFRLAPGTPVVHWEVAAVRGEAPMEIDGDIARATIGPFPADTLDTGTQHEVLVYVTDTERFGNEIFRGPVVILRDCSA